MKLPLISRHALMIAAVLFSACAQPPRWDQTRIASPTAAMDRTSTPILPVSSPTTSSTQETQPGPPSTENAPTPAEGVIIRDHSQAQEVATPVSISSPEAARDLALGYLSGVSGITLPVQWVSQDIPQTRIGETRYLYTAGDWVVNILASASPGQNYKVSVDNSQEGLHWQGEVTTQGVVIPR